MFEPGDQKVFGPDAFGPPSPRCANRIYALILFAMGLLGIADLFVREWVAGIILTLAGFVGSVLFLCPEISERRMVRRMRKRTPDAESSKKTTG